MSGIVIAVIGSASGSDPFSVTVPTEINRTTQSASDAVNVLATVTGGSGTYSYFWSVAAPDNITAENVNANPLALVATELVFAETAVAVVRPTATSNITGISVMGNECTVRFTRT